MTEKKVTKKKVGAKKEEAVTPEALNKPVEEKFETDTALLPTFPEGNLYTVRFTNKKVEERTLPQVIGLITGLDGVAKKITIELE